MSLNRVRARLEVSLARAGIDLPWWVPVCTTTASAVITLVSVVQRGNPLPTVPIALAGLLTIATPVAWAGTGTVMPTWAKAILVNAAVAILLTQPAVPDFAPMLLVVLAAEVGTISRPAMALTVTGASAGVFGVAGALGAMADSPACIVGIMLGLSGGALVRYYVAALDAEQGKQDAVREQAILAERQRIAQEVHDVVAHSLSITLLHLTGTRHALQQDRDVDEAVAGLIEAETVGRAAMADIRRAVGPLSSSPSDTRPLPGVDDIADLVERTRAAGLDVCFTQQGDLAPVGTPAGLSLYRIAQESLANIAKHAPHTTAQLRLRVDRTGTRLTVRNALPSATPGAVGNGSGLINMSTRATQLGADLRAGPDGDHWVVDVMVPGERHVLPEAAEPGAEVRSRARTITS